MTTDQENSRLLKAVSRYLRPRRQLGSLLLWSRTLSSVFSSPALFDCPVVCPSYRDTEGYNRNATGRLCQLADRFGDVYLLQLLVLSVHQRLPVIVKLNVMSLNVLQSSFSQHRAVLHRYDLDETKISR